MWNKEEDKKIYRKKQRMDEKKVGKNKSWKIEEERVKIIGGK